MRFAQMLTLIFGSSLMAAPALAAPALSAPRVAAYVGYTRLVLDLPAGVTHRLEPLGGLIAARLGGGLLIPFGVIVGLICGAALPRRV